MKKNIFISSLILLVTFFFISCKPHEERVMDRLDNLAEKVQKNGAKWNADQWADALEELEDIDDDMEDCEFTPQQLRALGRVKGKLTVIIMTEGAKKLGKELVPFLEGAGAFMKGYSEGVESMSDYSEGEFEKLGTQVQEELERFNAEMEEDE